MTKKQQLIACMTADDMIPAGHCPICQFEVYKYPRFGGRSVYCFNCKKGFATCQECGIITSVETWLFLDGILCKTCSSMMDREAAKAYFHITDFDNYYVALENNDGQWMHLGYND